jgi:hypothetical protein
MLHRAAYIILSVCLTSAAAGAANDPFVGAWKLNPSKSTIVDVMKMESAGGNKYVFDLGGGPEPIAVDGTEQPGAGGTLAVGYSGRREYLEGGSQEERSNLADGKLDLVEGRQDAHR